MQDQWLAAGQGVRRVQIRAAVVVPKAVYRLYLVLTPVDVIEDVVPVAVGGGGQRGRRAERRRKPPRAAGPLVELYLSLLHLASLKLSLFLRIPYREDENLMPDIKCPLIIKGESLLVP